MVFYFIGTLRDSCETNIIISIETQSCLAKKRWLVNVIKLIQVAHSSFTSCAFLYLALLGLLGIKEINT